MRAEASVGIEGDKWGNFGVHIETSYSRGRLEHAYESGAPMSL
jgi:hypothetical protein